MAALSLGTGRYRYELLPGWGVLPDGWQFGPVTAVAVDSQDRVYVYQHDAHPVVVFDRDGNFLASWGDGMITDAHGMFVTRDDQVYLVDRNAHRVLKFTADGKLMLALGASGKPSSQEPFNRPADVAVSVSGDIYVSDGYANSRVHKFSPEGELLLSWGTPGSGSGEFNVPHGIWVDAQDRVYIVDRENHRVQVSSDTGEFIAEWPGFHRPTDIHVDRNGIVYVTENSPRLTILDRTGTKLTVGELEDDGHGVWADSSGDIYVALFRRRRVAKYRNLG